jgi:site-specific recombinase XerD
LIGTAGVIVALVLLLAGITRVTLYYSAGLRSKEAPDLKVADISSKQLIVHSREGKFPRQLMLSSKMLECRSELATDRTRA